MNIDPYILIFSLVMVAGTVFMGFWTAKKSKTASDFFVAGRSVGVGMNASAISGEYLSAASFMGVAGMVMSSGYDALWYPVCYACGYLFLLLFIAGPLRRFGAYTIPDFAEGRFDSPLFRKIAVVFVLFIGFFYTMPQMKGAGTTLAYIFQDVDLRGGWFEFLAPHSAAGEAIKGFPYWAGVLIVGAVITLNVALGGMKGITLVQAFQYWAKMFAISVPIFVLMAVYGHYGKQVGVNGKGALESEPRTFIGTANRWIEIKSTGDGPIERSISRIGDALGMQKFPAGKFTDDAYSMLQDYSTFSGRRIAMLDVLHLKQITISTLGTMNRPQFLASYEAQLLRQGVVLIHTTTNTLAVPIELAPIAALSTSPVHAQWMHETRRTVLAPTNLIIHEHLALLRYVQQDRSAPPGTTKFLPLQTNGLVVSPGMNPISGVNLAMYYADMVLLQEGFKHGADMTLRVSPALENLKVDFDQTRMPPLALQMATHRALETNGIMIVRESPKVFAAYPTNEARVEYEDVHAELFQAARKTLPAKAPADSTWLNPFGPLTTKAAKAAKLSAEESKPYSLLYTFSLIIAIVCGTAGLPHILVRFYTNPDGVAAKRTTMWVMILIGVFYVFPPVFGVIGRNLMPDLYTGLAGIKGTDQVVLKLPVLLNEKYPPLGSILSGITCAGAFAAFMSTFSGLLVSMTGALAHDVYGRILRPKSTPEQRMRMFKIGAVLIGGVAVVLGSFVEPLEINFMVGQAFAIAAASYFPLLFMAVWWRRLTMKGAAIGMLAGGVCALAAAALTNFSNLASDKGPMGKVFAGFAPLNDFWAAHPLLRILCEQPAIWAVPLAITLMIVVSKLTAKDIPADIRMKMLVLHAPEKLGLKQEYIQEHQGGH